MNGEVDKIYWDVGDNLRRSRSIRNTNKKVQHILELSLREGIFEFLCKGKLYIVISQYWENGAYNSDYIGGRLVSCHRCLAITTIVGTLYGGLMACRMLLDMA